MGQCLQALPALPVFSCRVFPNSAEEPGTGIWPSCKTSATHGKHWLRFAEETFSTITPGFLEFWQFRLTRLGWQATPAFAAQISQIGQQHPRWSHSSILFLLPAYGSSSPQENSNSPWLCKGAELFANLVGAECVQPLQAGE